MTNNKLATNKRSQVILVILAFVLMPAALEMFHGRSPYNADGFFNPPWAALLLVPFAVLPESVGRAALVIVALAAYAFAAYRLGANKLTISLLPLSPPVMHGILNGNIDWLAVLGFVLPPWLGLFFLMIKPQVGLATIIFLFISIWREGGFMKMVKTFTPFGIAVILSVMVFGPWFLSISNDINLAGNSSLWPLSIPIGLTFLVASLRKNEIRYSMAASPFLSPYVIMHSWVGVFLALAPLTYETAAAVIGMWIVVIIRFFA
jgi:hypothetical protein